MLTLFALPKPFEDHNGVIQRNAIRSWTLLQCKPEILLFGDEKGTAATANELGVKHVPAIARNEYGTPLLNGMFEEARRAASHNILCYVNADIILMDDFCHAVQLLSVKSSFLMVGRRWDLDVSRPLNFEPRWQLELCERISKDGRLQSHDAIDFFVFPQNISIDMPPFAIGRPFWDNWFLFRVNQIGIPVVDATAVVMIVHQNHDYSHVPFRQGPQWQGPEANRNLELAGGMKHVYTLDDSTHLLTSEGLKLRLDWRRLKRHIHTIPELHPRLFPLYWMTKAAGRVLRGLQLR